MSEDTDCKANNQHKEFLIVWLCTRRPAYHLAHLKVNFSSQESGLQLL